MFPMRDICEMLNVAIFEAPWGMKLPRIRCELFNLLIR